MNAIERCRTAALGGHVARCTNAECGHTLVAYNSCRNRHCPKCQGSAAREWLEAREAELLPVPYFHCVFSLPAEIADIAYTNKAVVYDLLLKVSAEVMTTVAADPAHLGARIAITSVLHTWGSAMTHHPHVHMIVPGGGLSLDGTRWIRGKAAFLLPVRVLSALFRGRMLAALSKAHNAGRLTFFGDHAPLADRRAFALYLAPLRARRWHVYAKRPFGGPQAVLAYLARYTHRVAISSSRLIAADAGRVTFRIKNYRIDGPGRYTSMTVTPAEFIRRFLLHTLPKGLHRIRHYGLLAGQRRTALLDKARTLLRVKTIDPADDDLRRDRDDAGHSDRSQTLARPCPCCGAHMLIAEPLHAVCPPRSSGAKKRETRPDTS